MTGFVLSILGKKRGGGHNFFWPVDVNIPWSVNWLGNWD